MEYLPCTNQCSRVATIHVKCNQDSFDTICIVTVNLREAMEKLKDDTQAVLMTQDQ